ncbi:MAG: hypothetical protein JWP04_1280 [Belnapia sp.]|nr:hypothetical protein [Belnapia sp.]
MTNIPQISALETDAAPLIWLPQVMTLALAFALSFAMPTGTMLTLVLMAALVLAAGIAGLRRHGGAGVPILPFATED